MTSSYDYVIIGAGIYGLYAAKVVAEKGNNALVIDCEEKPFTRASFINQARVHNGYHYPRSYSTAIKSAKYFDRFCKDFDFAINNRFKKIYAISEKYSLTSGAQFKKFCQHSNIPCEEINSDRYFENNMVETTFETLEYSFDASKICRYLERVLEQTNIVDYRYNSWIISVEKKENSYCLHLNNGELILANNVINCSYASINQINQLFGFETFKIKYEIAEVIECSVGEELKDVGITVMDGPFFSIMPFGDTGNHTLTAVTFTPHKTCYSNFPTFDCQKKNPACTPSSLRNCNTCMVRPQTAYPYMLQLSLKYLKKPVKITYFRSLFAIKPILLASEIDDSRPTLIKSYSSEPGFTTILSGKINTIYDMEDVIV